MFKSQAKNLILPICKSVKGIYTPHHSETSDDLFMASLGRII